MLGLGALERGILSLSGAAGRVGHVAVCKL